MNASSPRKRKVGILGGMGPEATVLLMSRIVAATPARDDADHVPLVVEHNPQVPSRIEAFIDGTGEDPAPTLIAMARRLQTAGAEALAMPCNTAHRSAGEIAAAVDIPFLDMVELSLARLMVLPTPPKRVGVLASPAVRLTGIFGPALARHGIETVYCRDDGALLDGIRAIKAGRVDDAVRAALQTAAHELVEAGAGAVLVACSEFSLLAGSIAIGPPLIDTVDVLADAVIGFSLDDGSAAADPGERALQGRRRTGQPA